MNPPNFKYHPNPLLTGAFIEKAATCPCCARETAVVYAKLPYCVEDVEDLCPSCIADGSAARKYDAQFVDAAPLAKAGLSSEILDELCDRTPGYVSWQQEEWQSCCFDACEFHGDISKEELRTLPPHTVVELRNTHGITDDSRWAKLLQHYEPGGSPAIYKFVCRHCGRIMLVMDYD